MFEIRRNASDGELLGAGALALFALVVFGMPLFGAQEAALGGKAAEMPGEIAVKRDNIVPRAKPELLPTLLPIRDPAPLPHLDMKGPPDEGEKSRKRLPAIPAEKILIYDSSEGGHIQDLRLDPVIR